MYIAHVTAKGERVFRYTYNVYVVQYRNTSTMYITQPYCSIHNNMMYTVYVGTASASTQHTHSDIMLRVDTVGWVLNASIY